MGHECVRDLNAGRTWGALLIRRQLRVDRLGMLGAKCARWSGSHWGPEGWGCSMRGWMVVSEVAALPLCLGRLEEGVGRAA